MKTHIGLVLFGMLLASCARLPPPVPVISTSETPPPLVQAEVSGNPAIHVGRIGEPGLMGTDFVASASSADGLVLHDLQGSFLRRAAGARLTDLDITSLSLADSYSVVMGGPERARGRTRIILFRLDRGADQTLRRWGEITTDLSAPTGFCMRQIYGVVHAVIIDRRGQVRQFTVVDGPDGRLVADEISRFKVDRPGRGCAIDGGGLGHAYFSHARDGFWEYRLDTPMTSEPVRLRAAASHALPRSTGVSLLTTNDGRYLISQDQDRAAFSVWRLGAGLSWLGRFEVREQAGGRAVRTLVGIDAYGDGVGPFPNGLVVVQDQANDGPPNMKYIDWAEVRRSLGF